MSATNRRPRDLARKEEKTELRSRFETWESFKTSKDLRDHHTNLPENVVFDILSRIPARTLLKFMCVSKPWQDMISDPVFWKLHRCQSSKRNSLNIYLSISRHDNPNIWQPNTCEEKATLLLLSDEGSSSVQYRLVTMFKHNLGLRRTCSTIGLQHNHGIEMLHDHGIPQASLLSCGRDLICLATANGLYLLNPTTLERIKLPGGFGDHPHCEFRRQNIGFGYLDSTREYKVLRLFPSHASHGKGCEILTIRYDEYGSPCSYSYWRELDEMLPRQTYVSSLTNYDAKPVYVNNSLHWGHFLMRDGFVSFNMETEKFWLLKPPLGCQKIDLLHQELVELRGALWLVHYSYMEIDPNPHEHGFKGSLVDMWIWNKECWVKQYTLNVSPFHAVGLFPRPIDIQGNYMLFRVPTSNRETKLYRYDINGETFELCLQQSIFSDYSLELCQCTDGFSSLQGVFGKNSEVMR